MQTRIISDLDGDLTVSHLPKSPRVLLEQSTHKITVTLDALPDLIETLQRAMNDGGGVDASVRTPQREG